MTALVETPRKKTSALTGGSLRILSVISVGDFGVVVMMVLGLSRDVRHEKGVPAARRRVSGRGRATGVAGTRHCVRHVSSGLQRPLAAGMPTHVRARWVRIR